MLAPWPRLSILIIFGAELKKRGGGNNYVWRVLGQAIVITTRLLLLSPPVSLLSHLQHSAAALAKEKYYY